jgi:hypothetical protein
MKSATAIAILTVFAGFAAAALAHDGSDHGEPTPVPVVKGVPKKPTYHKHVGKILRARCMTCHHEGDIAPMSLETYDDAVEWMDLALVEIAAGRMPPWQPTPGVGLYEGVHELTDREWATLDRWVAQGKREGKPRKKTVAPEFDGDWTLGTPDAVLSYGESFTVPGQGDDIYRCFPIRTDFGRDVFVQAIDVKPGDRRVVHHVVLYLDGDNESHVLDDAEDGPGYVCFGGPGLPGFGEFDEDEIDLSGGVAGLVLGGWAPGNRPHLLPEGHGVRIPDGATVVMQVHYHPLDGEEVPDASEFGLYLTDHPSPTDVYLLPLVDMDFTIPAGDPAYAVTAELNPSELLAAAVGLPIRVSAEVHAVLPHMHLLGKEIAVDLDLSDGTSQRLVEIERWDFDWQDTYHFQKPVPAPFGSTLRLRCVFDNSADNPFNPNVPPRPVSWGEQTTDEMALAFVAVSLRFPDSVLDLFALRGQPLPHPRGLRPIAASKPPQIRRVRIDRKNRLVVDVKRLKGGGRIEIEGTAVRGSLVTARNPRRLRIDADTAIGELPAGNTIEVRVRRVDGRLSEPFSFTR